MIEDNNFKILDSLIKKTDAIVKFEKGDYIKDGLWHCGKCQTPKQVKIFLLGEERIVKCLCQCESDKRDQAEAERKRRDQMQRIERLREAGFSDEEFKNWNFAADDQKNSKLTRIAKKYVENFAELKRNGKGLLLYGDTGTGKTFIAACIANALIDKCVSCMITNFARLVNSISGSDKKQEILSNINQFDLLIIDDLSSERDTEYMNEIVYNIIDSRYRSGKPMIVTTNLTAEEIKNPSDIRKQRIYSRIYEMCIPVKIEGADRRKTKLRENYEKYNKLLGL